MKSLSVVLLSMLVVLSSSSQLTTHPADVCFHKYQKCCYKFKPCGFVTRKKKIVKDCSFKTCNPHCFKKCRLDCHFVKAPRRVCFPKTVKVCDHKGDHYSGTTGHNGRGHCKHITEKRCRVEVVRKKVCKRSCQRVCVNKCRKVHATCVRFRVFKFYKFCPILRCFGFDYKGSHRQPKPFVSRDGQFVKETDGGRRIVKKIPHHG